MNINLNEIKKRKITIWQTWRGNLAPPIFDECLESWHKCNTSRSERILQEDLGCVDFVRKEFPEFLPTYLSYPPGILRADIWRVLVLYKYGGVYADIDVECLRPLEELLAAVGHDDWELLLTTDHPIHERDLFGGRTMWMNDFMIAKPGSRFLKRVMEAFVAQGGGEHHPAAAVMVTGPGLFSRLVEEAGGPEAAGITPMPWQWIHPLPDMSNEFPEKAEYLRQIRERTWRGEHDPFVVHYWHHTWCRAGNMLSRWGELLHQTDGEIVERRLWRLEDEGSGADKGIREKIRQLGRALADFAEMREKIVWLLNPGAEVIELAALALAGLGREVICPGWAQDAGISFPPGAWPGVEIQREEINGTTNGEKMPGEAVPVSLKGSPTVVRLVPWPENWDACAEAHGRPGLAVTINCMEETKELLRLMVPGGFLAVPHVPTCGIPDGWELLPEADQEEWPVYQRANPVPFAIPRLIHLLVSGESESDTALEHKGKWQSLAGEGWMLRCWSAEDVRTFIRDEAGDFYDDWCAYKQERARMAAAGYLILAKLGGLVPEPSFPLSPDADLESVLGGRRIVFGGREHVRGAMLSHPDAVDRSFMACEAGHPFWNGLVLQLQM